MTDSPEPKKKRGRGKKAEPEVVEPASESPPESEVAAPASDPTMSDGDATKAPHVEAEGTEESERTRDEPLPHGTDDHGDAAADSVPPSSSPASSDREFDSPVSGFYGDNASNETDVEMTVNLTGDMLRTLPGRDDLEAPTQVLAADDLADAAVDRVRFQQRHLRGALEALIFASDQPLKSGELAKRASAAVKEVKEQLLSLKSEYSTRGIHLEEIAGGWVFRTSPEFAPFVRELSKEKPIKLSRAQLETLAILAYRQPITRPEIDDIRGVDSGPVLKVLLDRDLIRILGKKDEPGRPILYGTTAEFLEFFQLKALKDLPTLKEFTELSEDSRRVVEDELGESLEVIQAQLAEKDAAEAAAAGGATLGEAEATGEVASVVNPDAGGEIHDASTHNADTAEVPIQAARGKYDTITNEDEEPAHAEKQAADADEASDDLDDEKEALPPTNEDDEAMFPDDDDSDFDDDDDDDDEDDEDEDEEDGASEEEEK